MYLNKLRLTQIATHCMFWLPSMGLQYNINEYLKPSQTTH